MLDFFKESELLYLADQATCYQLFIALNRSVISNKKTLFYWLTIIMILIRDW